MSGKLVELDSIASIGAAGPAPLTSAQRTRAFDAFTLSLFTLSIFTSASLLFVVQPLVGKLLLPKLGGAPAVWNTCMVFFQGVLLLGYLAAHLLSKHFTLRVQAVVFACGLMLALQTLPMAVDPEWVDRLLAGADPNLWLLGVLCSRVAPVFFVLSITSPLLQKWFAQSGHPQGRDPYFLYAASNIGSILALLSYPLLLEVSLGVGDQSLLWKAGFSVFLFLGTLCGVASWWGGSRRSVTELQGRSPAPASTSSATAIAWRRRGYWTLLAAIPSSLMLGVTTYISTDVSSMPLIWVIPLTLYLLTFVIAFGRRRVVSAYWMGRIAALLMLAITVTLVTGANDPPVVIVPMQLLMFFAVALYCHQGLAADRPDPEYLTEFYLCLSVGGVLGGMFNALLAPAIFPVILEYPLAIIAASLVRETRAAPASQRAVSIRRVLVFGAAIFSFTLLANELAARIPEPWLVWLSQAFPLSPAQLTTLLALGVPACIVFHHLESRAYFGMGLAAILLVNVWNGYADSGTLERGRNFYGTIRTAREQMAGGEVVKMLHGNTVHGWQWTDPARRAIPLTYYGHSSGVGRLIADRQSASEAPLRIGAIGLGAGTLAATVRPGDTLVYYEINPQVLDHAERHFTYLGDARRRGAAVETRLGDARLVLEAEARNERLGRYDILVVDAFSSDSIPVHLLTHECLRVYLEHLTPDGVLAFHITNRYLDLEPVLAAVAKANGLSGNVYTHRDLARGAALDEHSGETTSNWVLLSRQADAVADIPGKSPPKPLTARPGDRPWTDDYSNVLGAFELRL